MRVRRVVLVLAILAVAGVAALNWPLFMRTDDMNFGVLTLQASLPLILLTILGITLLAFLVSSASSERRHLVEYREHGKALQAQRDLADKAEASRFTDLRQHIDTQLRENRQREGLAVTELEKNVTAQQRELRAQLEQINRTLAARLGGADIARHDGPRPDLAAENRALREDRAELRDGLRNEGRNEGRNDPRPDAVRPGSKTTVL